MTEKEAINLISKIAELLGNCMSIIEPIINRSGVDIFLASDTENDRLIHYFSEAETKECVRVFNEILTKLRFIQPLIIKLSSGIYLSDEEIFNYPDNNIYDDMSIV